ncbi:PBSX family phage terminase large subunit [Halalkalicoccus sp. NIPERK01]|uniref:PBSX family phage terminase large subunit n=1 Tax=Halalkalicoccus sp. NIPERK01 TaxID=3053469 RepID=UPI00256F3D47|nr:phage terminase large subunit [Halalkalicoccus sp. NIPERK01]MDL5361362.1 phage terminase large subunit [Halalkalicoccus sp. NIPERK01]
MSTTGTSRQYRDAFPEPTHSRFDRGADTTTDLAPYRHDETGLAPQAQFLAGPAGQADIVSEARNHAFVSGLGAGKTASLIIRAWVNAEHWNPGELGMLIAPTVPAIKNVILPEMRSMGLLDVCEYNGKGSERPGIITPSGSRIILESADNTRKIERLRGPSIAWAGMDEASSIAERAYEIITGRLRTGEYRNLFVSTTPKGFNWVHDRFYDDPDPTIRYEGAYEWLEANGTNGVFGVPSWLNPHNPDDYIERLEEEFDGSFFQQEVQGAFTKFEGLVYPWFSRPEHVIDDLPEEGEYDEVIYGVDWGFNNPGVILALVRQGDRWVVVEEFYERRCTDEDMAEHANDMIDRWGPGRMYCDPAEPASIETFRRKGVPARSAENAVTPGIKRVSSLQDDLRVHQDCQSIRNEFSQYQYKDAEDSDDPLKENDHAMDALRYALFTHNAGPTVNDLGWGS